MNVQLPYLAESGYFEAYQKMRLNRRALINYCLYVKSRLMQVIDEEENRRIWEWIRKTTTGDSHGTERHAPQQARSD